MNALIPHGRLQKQLQNISRSKATQLVNAGLLRPVNPRPRIADADSGIRAELKKLARKVDALAGQVGYTRKGHVVPADYNRGISAHTTGLPKGKGGYVYSNTKSFAMGAVAAGDKQTLKFTDNDESRLQGTIAALVEFIVDSEIAANANRYEVTAQLNGFELQEFYRIPLDKLISDLDGEQLAVPLNVEVGASDDLTFEIVARVADNFDSAQSITARVLAAGEEY